MGVMGRRGDGIGVVRGWKAGEVEEWGGCGSRGIGGGGTYLFIS